MLNRQQLCETLVTVLDHSVGACAEIDYRLVGTGSALLQGVVLPAGDIDILVKERKGVDAFSAALASFECRFSPAWMPEAGQYYADYEVDGVGVGVSTVEAETESEAKAKARSEAGAPTGASEGTEAGLSARGRAHLGAAKELPGRHARPGTAVWRCRAV